jgi:hypothetical protein
MAFGRRRSNSPDNTTGNPPCTMCGRETVVDAAGRCPLGHVVAGAAPTVTQPTSWEPGPEAAADFTVPTPVVVDVEEPAADAAEETVAIAEVAVEVDEYAFLADHIAPEQAAPAEDAAPTETESEARHALEELLAMTDHSAASSLDIDTRELPSAPFAPESSDEAPYEPIAAPEEESDDVIARRRAAGLLGGGLLTLAVFGSIAILPPL